MIRLFLEILIAGGKRKGTYFVGILGRTTEGSGECNDEEAFKVYVGLEI